MLVFGNILSPPPQKNATTLLFGNDLASVGVVWRDCPVGGPWVFLSYQSLTLAGLRPEVVARAAVLDATAQLANGITMDVALASVTVTQSRVRFGSWDGAALESLLTAEAIEVLQWQIR